MPAYQRFVKIVQCLLTINIQWLPCAVIKFHVVKEAKKDALYFVQDEPNIGLIYSLLTAKCIDSSLLIDYSTYFKDVIQYYFGQFSPVSA